MAVGYGGARSVAAEGDSAVITTTFAACRSRLGKRRSYCRPSAPGLRVLVGSMHSVADAERVGGLALHAAKLARRACLKRSMDTSPK